MKKIALTAAALLVATGSAFAASDHFGSDGVNQPAPASVDSSYTSAIQAPDSAVYKFLNSDGSAKSAPQDDSQDLFGNR